jgi:hypothetical protein
MGKNNLILRMFKKVIEKEIDLPSAGDGEGISVMSCQTIRK